MTTETTSPGSAAIIEQNALIRAEGLVTNKADLHFALSIPEFDYHLLVRANPDLEAPDRDIKGAAWKRYIASSESKPYRVTG